MAGGANTGPWRADIWLFPAAEGWTAATSFVDDEIRPSSIEVRNGDGIVGGRWTANC